MRRFLAVLPLVAAVALLGCHGWPYRPDASPNGQAALFKANTEPKAAELVAYLNDNSRRVPGLFCQTVYIDATQGNQKIGMDALMACEKSRDFRMKAKVAGNYVGDFGSNQDEFWYWISKAEPPYVYHGKYADMKTARATLPIPFQPDIVIAALGVGEYDPNAKYEVRTTKEGVELIEPSVSIQGKPVWKVTVFNRGQVTATKPQVLKYRLIDEAGHEIAVASVVSTQVNRETGATLPKIIQLTLIPEKGGPNDKVDMRMNFENLQVRSFDKDQRATIFALNDALSNRQGFDMGSGLADAAPGAVGMGTSIQRTNGTLPPGR
jgi:hypothetical protein